MAIATGEYGFVLRDFRDLPKAGAVDCLQVGGAPRTTSLSVPCGPSV